MYTYIVLGVVGAVAFGFCIWISLFSHYCGVEGKERRRLKKALEEMGWRSEVIEDSILLWTGTGFVVQTGNGRKLATFKDNRLNFE